MIVLALFYRNRLHEAKTTDILGKPISNTKFSLLLISSALAALSLTLFQNMLDASQSLTHQGFVLVVNCMFMLPVVFLLSGLIERSRRR